MYIEAARKMILYILLLVLAVAARVSGEQDLVRGIVQLLRGELVTKPRLVLEAA